MSHISKQRRIMETMTLNELIRRGTNSMTPNMNAIMSIYKGTHTVPICNIHFLVLLKDDDQKYVFSLNAEHGWLEYQGRKSDGSLPRKEERSPHLQRYPPALLCDVRPPPAKHKVCFPHGCPVLPTEA